MNSVDTWQPACLDRGTLFPLHSNNNSCLVHFTGKYPVGLREKIRNILKRDMTDCPTSPPTRVVSINVGGFTGTGTWMHRYADGTSQKGVPKLHCGLGISSNERANRTQMPIIQSITNTSNISPGTILMSIWKATWMSSYLNGSYQTCKRYADLLHRGFMFTELIKHYRAGTLM